MPRVGLKLIFALTLGLLFSGCALFSQNDIQQSALSRDAIKQANEAAVELLRLEQLERPAKADYRRRATLRQQLWQFERKVIRAAVRLEQQDAWPEADKVFQQAVKAVPSSHILRFARFQYAKRRSIREDVLRAELEINKGEQLLQNAKAYDTLKRVTPLRIVTWLEAKAYQRRRVDSAAKLERFADKALERQDYYLARRCLSLSKRLDDNKEVQSKLVLADAHIRKMHRRAKTSKAPESGKPDVDLLVSAFHHAMQKGDYVAAHQYLTELRKEHPKYRNLVSMSSQYNMRLNRRVNKALEQGKELYSEGKVEQALKVWREVEPIAPNHVELLSSIARAETVLQNLRVLSAKQSDEYVP